MAKGRLLPKEPLRREFRQQVSFVDPVTHERIEAYLAVIHTGDNKGCPVVEINDRLVTWDLKELLAEAVIIFRENAVLRGRKKPEPVDNDGVTGFSSVKKEGMTE